MGIEKKALTPSSQLTSTGRCEEGCGIGDSRYDDFGRGVGGMCCAGYDTAVVCAICTVSLLTA